MGHNTGHDQAGNDYHITLNNVIKQADASLYLPLNDMVTSCECVCVAFIQIIQGWLQGWLELDKSYDCPCASELSLKDIKP